jgi:acetate kinase
MRLLTVNAGSSSLKLSMVDEHDQMVAMQEMPAPGSTLDTGELRRAIEEGFAGAEAVVHRIVHGGQRFHDAVVLDAQVECELRRLGDLAPLHQLKSLAGLDAVSALLPGLPAVACFDTAFHATLPPSAYTYALPARWRERWGLRRFGFHGLSHSWSRAVLRS